jgi:hypothetical protein
MIESEDRKLNLLPYLAGLAALDADFRERFLEDPEYVAREHGLYLTEKQVRNIQALDPAQVAEWLDHFEDHIGQPIMAMSAW